MPKHDPVDHGRRALIAASAALIVSAALWPARARAQTTAKMHIGVASLRKPVRSSRRSPSAMSCLSPCPTKPYRSWCAGFDPVVVGKLKDARRFASRTKTM